MQYRINLPFLMTLIPRGVFAVSQRLQAHGKRSWLVGGCVRDLLLGRHGCDWDFATDAVPDDVMRIFSHVIPTGIRHGTVTVIHGKEHYEVTTLRGEAPYTDGRRPDFVYFVSDLEADLARRDFTINAIALDLLQERLIDPFGGLSDLKRGLLKAVGNPLARFCEDGLRILRAARFVATLSVELDPATELAMDKALDTYRKVSQERVRGEWLKTMKAASPSRAFEVMRKAGILQVTCPELLEGVGFAQNRYHAYDVWRHNLECMDRCRGDPILRVAALMHDIGKPRTRGWSEKHQDYTFYNHDQVGAEMVGRICRRLRFSNEEQQRIAHLVRCHMFYYTPEWTDAAVRRWVKRVGPEHMESFYTLHEADVLSKGKETADGLESLAGLKAHVNRVLAQGATFSTRDLAVNGGELIKELGLQPGPLVGQLLRSLLEEVLIDSSVNCRQALLERARALLRSSISST
ncbi:hypothetical protein BCY86_03725 [Pajaroellobacter abortibovis]|uniref:HD domain-containing protein n=2 Tax=Pajaroellobacter abortibovis TaxID=1882918 RepID=A0A1L6MZC1_9BACT|nr:hypothetical protein BCY86_03725 [Pajaroellobacter abortibovis]